MEDLKERKLAINLDIERIDLLEQGGSITQDLFALRSLRKKEQGDVLLKEEVHWRQSSRIKWIKEENSNSKFFHRVENGRRKKKFIKSLVTEDGENLSGNGDILDDILNIFRRLYTKPERNSWKIEGLDWSPTFA